MDDARDAWKDVATKVEALGLKLKLHLDQEKDVAVADRAEGDTSNAFDQLSTQVTDAFDAFGNAAKDEAVHADVQEIAQLIKEALIETFQAVGAEVGEIIEQIEDYAEDAAEELAEALGIDDADADLSLESGVQDTVESAVQDTIES